MGCCCGTLRDRVNAKFSKSQILAKEIFWASLQHQRSQGFFQIQGNGALVLTSDVLWFNLLAPYKEIEMPLQNIRAVQSGRGLSVTFVDPSSGIEDEVVIWLRNAQFWYHMIMQLLTSKPVLVHIFEL